MAPGPWLTFPEAYGKSEGQVKGTPVSLKGLPPATQEKADTYSRVGVFPSNSGKGLALTCAYLQLTLLDRWSTTLLLSAASCYQLFVGFSPHLALQFQQLLE